LNATPKDHYTDSDFEEVREWLGPQADALTGEGLDWVEVYCGAARATQAVQARGGCGLKLGLQDGQDFRNVRDQELSFALIVRAKPRHVSGLD
jgi:hypothetical protein